jgi:hypothetical protein
MTTIQNAFCSIITHNRLAWVRTLMQSIREHHADIRCLVLVIDHPAPEFQGNKEEFEFLSLDEFQLTDVARLTFQYTPFEMCCALKPILLRHLLRERGFEKAIYLDSDILVLSALKSVFRLLDDHDLALTPHLDLDLPDDGKKPDDAHVMLSGVFNAGFVGVKNSEEGLRFLDWWAGKLENGCIEDHFNGRFVDQKYLDMAVGLFSNIGILRDPGCNTAYWNLHSRKITRQNGSWQANGEPLVFYHFSDYRLDRPHEMSGHQDRFSLENLPELKALFDHYRTLVLANGDEVCRTWDYSFGKYRNGRRIKPWTRRAYLLNRDSQPPFDPFDSSQHTIRFRLQSALQAGLMLFNRFVHKARRFF